MKFKKFVVSVTAMFVMAAILASTSVFAAVNKTSVDLTFTEVNATHVGYNQKASAKKYNITKIGDASGTALANYYCGYPDVGFENRTGKGTSDTYNTKYTMTSDSDTKGEIQNLNVTSSTKLYSTDTIYNGIRALADLMYLGSDSEVEYKAYMKKVLGTSSDGYFAGIDSNYRNYLNYYDEYDDEDLQEAFPEWNPSEQTIDEYIMNEYLNSLIEITPDQIRDIQQMAIWHIATNGSIDFIKDTQSDYAIIRRLNNNGGDPINYLSDLQVEQTRLLYNYLVGNASTNAANTNYKYINTVYLYVDSNDDDEQPIIQIVPGEGQIDLALRKFITKITMPSGVDRTFTSREPQITAEELAKLSNGNATYDDGTTLQKTHTKTPLEVGVGDKVIYKIRIYNEGDAAGYAGIVTDYIPDGLMMVPTLVSTINAQNGWSVNDNGVATTTLLSNNDKKLEAFDKTTNTLDFVDLEIECIVTGTSKNLKNVAEISQYLDENKNEVEEDIDSTRGNLTDDEKSNYNPGNSENGIGYEDDDDYEDLLLKEFDLALRKHISKITTGETATTYNAAGERVANVDKSKLNNPNTTAEYKHRKDPIAVETGSKVEYTLTVYNEADIAGRASKIIDRLPAGVILTTEGTVTSKKGNIYSIDYNEETNTVTLTTTGTQDIAAYNGTLDSDSLVIECEVTATPDEEDDKVYTNIAWIAEHKNIGNYPDRDSNYKKTDDANHTPTIPDLVTTDNGYTNNDNNDLTDKDHYFKGQEDDDDFEKIKIKTAKFDLALRKFIVQINNEDVETSREPVITDTEKEKLVNRNATFDDGTTLEKTHTKAALGVTKGDTVLYTIRVYNEGDIDGYAEEVTDYLPEGLTMVPYIENDGSINGTYKWDGDGNKITTDYLSKAKGEAKMEQGDTVNPNLIKAFDTNTKTLYFKDVQIECFVNNNATSKNLRNIAEITDAEDENGNKKDVDSRPENLTDDEKSNYNPGTSEDGKGYEDDDDYEDLKIVEFDLALRKYITKVEDKDGNTVTISNLTGRTPNIDKSQLNNPDTTAEYKHRKDPVVVKPGYFVYYNLTVYNEGDIAGRATKIVDTLPAGVKFVSVESGNFESDGTYTTTNNTLTLVRKSGNTTNLVAYTGQENLDSETVKIKCEVTVDEETGGDKIYTNIAWIAEDYNVKGENVKDRDSQPSTHPTENKLVTNYSDNGYIGNIENEDKDLADSDEYFMGEQDDDDFEKIIIYKEPLIHKGVKTVENQDSGYYDNEDNLIDINEKHQWVIQSTLPVNIKDYLKYQIVDDVDYRLVYGEVSEVNIIDNNGQKLEKLEEGTDYTLTYIANTEHVNEISTILGQKYSGTIELTFIDANNGKTISNKLENRAGNKIEVRFTTTFAKDENGKLRAKIIGTQIPNKAKLEYTNESGENKNKESEEPEVHTGGITLFKYYTSNGTKVGLKDAEFAIYKTEVDAKNKQNAIQTVKSDEKGLVEFVGLEYGEDAEYESDGTTVRNTNKQSDGTYIQLEENKRKIPGTDYWIVETKAPKGYKTITTPIKVTINNGSYKIDLDVLVTEEELKTTGSNRLVENKPLEFDLALRKFITKVNDKDPKVSREPVVDTTKLKNETATTAEYKHTKEAVDVVNGDIVTYTLRIYNEGQVDGYAEIVTDDIPTGVEFLPSNATNKEYRWEMYAEKEDGKTYKEEDIVKLNIKEGNKVKEYVKTNDASKAVIIRTDYLSKAQGEKNLIKAYDAATDKLDYRDLKVVFKVTEPNGSKRIITNYAQVSKHKDKDGNDVPDRDSVPDRWNKGEDDQDIENLRVPEFDLALRKWVTQAIVIENGETTVTETGHDAWDDPEEIVKVELHRKKLSDVVVKFRYSIRVYNQGELEGYAKEVKDYIPEGLQFVQEDNPDWKVVGDNIITTNKLENTLLKTGEYADVEVLLKWINGEDNLGLKVNTAEISKDYNEKGVPDKDSTPDNKKPGEDDIDDAPVMLSVSTGEEKVFIIFGIAAGILIVLAGGIFLIKKYVI